MRNATFLLGAVLFIFGAYSHIAWVHTRIDFDPRTIEIGLGAGVFSLDVVALVLGTMIMGMSWILHRLVDQNWR